MSAYDPPIRPVAAGTRDLDDRECAELDELLAGIPRPFSPMGVVALDGYLCGVLVQPVQIATDEWLPYVFDTDARRLPTEVADDIGIDRATALVLRRHQALQRSLAEDGAFDPLIVDLDDEEAAGEDGADVGTESDAGAGSDVGAAPDAGADGLRGAGSADASAREESPAAGTPAPAAGDETHDEPDVPAASRPLVEWVAGFHFATGRFTALEELDDDAVDLALMRIYRHLPAEDDEQREVQATMDAELPLTSVDDAVEDLVAAVADIDDLTRELRFRVDTVRRDGPKVGRNDACPCGSGKKYKRCHGAGAA